MHALQSTFGPLKGNSDEGNNTTNTNEDEEHHEQENVRNDPVLFDLHPNAKQIKNLSPMPDVKVNEEHLTLEEMMAELLKWHHWYNHISFKRL